MRTVKEMIIHNQVQTLSHLYIMLASSISPTIVPHREGVEVVPCSFPKAAMDSIEVGLIEVVNRIADIARNSKNWTVDKQDESDYLDGMQEAAQAAHADMIAALIGGGVTVEKPQPKKRNKKKGGTDDQ